MAAGLASVRYSGWRLLVLGVGGGAGNASHAVNDFRKLCAIEAYALTDNVSELTARTNDEGWETFFATWLAGSNARAGDAVFVFSAGGGNEEKQVSVNIVRALQLARERNLKIFGVVGRDDGFTAQEGEAVLIVPTISESRITPHTEAFQAVVWHCLVSHLVLQVQDTKW